ncbi:hypothetical protein LYNGBM3L_03660 [Moorena producens 3L]|uniref:Uncharacterized protein n=1 Tax=Moorena producens 3L TaxID=489825 RepID=F4XRQ7_9CYAN|nr:hypothetical protein LYNGBM3L_03660 [Moorena producens 3L]
MQRLHAGVPPMSDCIKKGLVLNANQPRPAKLVIPKGQIGARLQGREQSLAALGRTSF